MGARLQEAARLGFRRALVPPGCAGLTDGVEALDVPDLLGALRFLNDSVSTRRPDNVIRLDAAR
jgi:DNA repair protein RadA/Sms